MYGHKKGIADTVAVIPAPGKDWFVTTFDRGFGKRFYHRGKVGDERHIGIGITVITSVIYRNCYASLGRIYRISLCYPTSNTESPLSIPTTRILLYTVLFKQSTAPI